MSTSTLWQVGPDGTCTYPAPLPHVRFAFTARGTCSVCGLTDVVGTPNMVYRDGAEGAVSYDSKQDVSVSCALCTMTGRA